MAKTIKPDRASHATKKGKTVAPDRPAQPMKGGKGSPAPLPCRGQRTMKNKASRSR